MSTLFDDFALPEPPAAYDEETPTPPRHLVIDPDAL
ncbi:MAG: hypothetical protein QOF57_2202, partial [Frankiaceae bacterium]|nr:hypothetical protein [Frankiaceae bacterium]